MEKSIQGIDNVGIMIVMKVILINKVIKITRFSTFNELELNEK